MYRSTMIMSIDRLNRIRPRICHQFYNAWCWWPVILNSIDMNTNKLLLDSLDRETFHHSVAKSDPHVILHSPRSSADNYRLLNSLATYKGHSKINSTTKTHDIVWSSCVAFKLILYYIGLLYGPYAHDYYVVPLLHLRHSTETQSEHAGRQFSSDLL